MLATARALLSGFLMGTADLVPGVSGGTMALVLGIYERLVFSIREGSSALGAVLKVDFRTARQHLAAIEWRLILPLLAGILLAVLMLSRFLDRQIEQRPTILAGAFLGLVLGSVPVAWRRLLRPELRHAAISLVVATSLFLLLGLGTGQVVGDPTLLALVGAGAVAICAMILPGISGSLILVLIGMYGPVLGAVADGNLPAIALFGLGAVGGLALFSQILHWLLRTHHDVLLAGLVGLMAGSTRMLWPWPQGVASPVLGSPEGDWPIVLVAGLLGAGAVRVISRLVAAREEGSVSELPAP